MTRFPEGRAEIRERMAGAAVPTMMAFHPRELAAAAAAADIPMGAPQLMVLAAVPAAAMEMAAAVVVAALTLRLWVEPEAQGEPRVPRVSTPAAVAAREPITALGVPAGMLEAQEAAPETKEQRVRHSPKRDRVEEPFPVGVASVESVQAVAAAVANMGLKLSPRFFLDPAAAAAAAMTMARSVEGTEETVAGSFSLWRIQLPSREV